MTQEPWDLEKFVTKYNALADEMGAWYYESDGRTPDQLGQRYAGNPESFPTIQDFARGQFTWQQRVDGCL